MAPPVRRRRISSTGWSAADIQRHAKNIDTNNNGKIEKSEVRDFVRAGEKAGFKNRAARDKFGRYEAAATMLSLQAKGGITKDYLKPGGDYDKQMKKLGTSSAELQQIRDTFVAESDAQLGSDMVDELRDLERRSYDANTRKAAAGAAKHVGYKDGFLIDADRDGKVSDGDRFAVQSAGGTWQTLDVNKIMSPRELRAAAGMRDAMRAFKSQKAGFAVTLGKAKLNGDWSLDAPGKQWQLGKTSASSAIDDIWSAPGKTAGDCAMYKQLAAHSALSSQMGKADYDNMIAKHGLDIGYGGGHNKSGISDKIIKNGPSWASHPRDYEAGWMGYAEVEADGVSPTALANAGWAGEHFAVTLGDDGKKYVLAHPMGAVPVEDFEATLKSKVASAFGIDPADVHLKYKTPQYYDVDEAKKHVP